MGGAHGRLVSCIEAGLSAPSATAAHLVRLLKDRLETIDMGFGVDLMTLAAFAHRNAASDQTGLTETTHRPHPEKLIDALVSRLGKRTVRRLFPKESHIPELAQTSANYLCRASRLGRRSGLAST